MAVTLQCKMCAGDLVIMPGSSVCYCASCGTKQTVPTADSERIRHLFNRANEARKKDQFDRAIVMYEQIIAESPSEAEAYWGLVLCKYGIEYVDSPEGRKVPTCHRTSYESLYQDGDVEKAIRFADPVAQAQYRAEAQQLEELRREIVKVSARQEPYDIFISYKERDDATGSRTLDSVIAQQVYDELTEKGYRVFFSRVTLEDMIGQNYEPVIFAALHSARVMLVFGTRREYFDAVWVRNEWSRYLSLIAHGEKKTLVPCYKGIDINDLPPEFLPLQAQDMGEVGAVQDLLRGLEKIIGKSGRGRGDASGYQQASPYGQPAAYQQPGRSAVPGAETPEDVIGRAGTWLSMREYKKAEGEYERMTSRWPDRWEGWWGLLVCRTNGLSADIPDAEREQLFERTRQFCPAYQFSAIRREYGEYLRIPAKRLGQVLMQDARSKTAGVTEQRCREHVNSISEAQRSIQELRVKAQNDAEWRKTAIAENQAKIREMEQKAQGAGKNGKKTLLFGILLIAAAMALMLYELADPDTGGTAIVGWIITAAVFLWGISRLVSYFKGQQVLAESQKQIANAKFQLENLNSGRGNDEIQAEQEIAEKTRRIEWLRTQLVREQQVLEKQNAFLASHEKDFGDYQYSAMCRKIGLDVPFTGTIRVPDYR